MIVVEIAQYTNLRAVRRFAPQAHDFPPADDTLPRRQRESVRRTLRLAKSTLNALVDEPVALRQRLQVLEMYVGIVVDDNTGIEQPLRVEQHLYLPHQRIGFGAPFEFDKRSDIAAGTMLGLERAVVFLDDHPAHRIHEAPIP